MCNVLNASRLTISDGNKTVLSSAFVTQVVRNHTLPNKRWHTDQWVIGICLWFRYTDVKLLTWSEAGDMNLLRWGYRVETVGLKLLTWSCWREAFGAKLLTWNLFPNYRSHLEPVTQKTVKLTSQSGSWQKAVSFTVAAIASLEVEAGTRVSLCLSPFFCVSLTVCLSVCLSVLKNSLYWSLLYYCSVRMMWYFRQKLVCFVFKSFFL